MSNVEAEVLPPVPARRRMWEHSMPCQVRGATCETLRCAAGFADSAGLDMLLAGIIAVRRIRVGKYGTCDVLKQDRA
jgi:hypothetical protein